MIRDEAVRAVERVLFSWWDTHPRPVGLTLGQQFAPSRAALEAEWVVGALLSAGWRLVPPGVEG